MAALLVPLLVSLLVSLLVPVLGAVMVSVAGYCLVRALTRGPASGHRRDLDGWHAVMGAAMALRHRKEAA